MALANLALLTFFAHHVADPVVRVVVVPTVCARDGVAVDRLAVLPGLMVDVSFGALHALLVTGDKGPNTHWVHGENIESIVNM